MMLQKNKYLMISLCLFIALTSRAMMATEYSLLQCAQRFLGRPYKAHTLDLSGKEKLVINKKEFDCVTFVETSLAEYRSSLCNKKTFAQELLYIRYRNGKLEAYTSRLHYFAEWILNNQQKGLVSDITKSLGGIPIQRTFSIMSSHPQWYPKLKNKKFLTEIINSEKTLSATSFYYLPTEKLASGSIKIPAGSIIAFVSKREDILIAHTGLAIEENGITKVLHASSYEKKVTISQKSLYMYLKNSKTSIGVIVLAPLSCKSI